MNIIKKALCLLLITLLAIGACGCMNTTVLNRKESDDEYSKLMLSYLNSRYNRNFNIVEAFFPKESFNNSMKVNTLVVQDEKTGIIVNIYAPLEKPYNYYDNYVNSMASYMLKERIDTSNIEKYGKSKLYAYLNNQDFENIDINDTNINKVTLVININANPSEDVLKELYHVYEELSEINSKYTFMIIGFTEQSEVFTKYVSNFAYYGVKEWDEYSGKVYATMKISEKGLNYNDFFKSCEKCG